MASVFYIYIMTDNKNSKFAIDFTNNLVKRVHELKNSQEGAAVTKGFNKLVYFEKHTNYADAIRREKEIRDWDNEYLKQIVILQNPKLDDFYNKIF